MSRLASLMAIISACMLGACSHVPLPSLPALAAIDFETTDFGQLRAMIDLPESLVPQREGVLMNVILTLDDEITEDQSFVLIREEAETQEPRLDRTMESGRHRFIYSLSNEDQQSFESIRRTMAAARAVNQSGSLTLTITARDLCRSGSLPEGPLLVDVFLQTSETGGFVRTLDGYDLRELSGAGLGALEPCPPPASAASFG